MPDNSRSSREIEREIEQERAELRGTIDEIMNRLTFQDAWNRAGEYMRDNRSEFGYTLGRMVKEKPIAVALTAVGVSWLLFGPSSGTARPGARAAYPGDERAHGATDAYSRTETRSPLSATEPGAPAQGRFTPETGAGRPPVPADTRTGSPATPTPGATTSTPGTSTPSSTGTTYSSERPTPSTTGAASTTPRTATAGSAGSASTTPRPATTTAGSASTTPKPATTTAGSASTTPKPATPTAGSAETKSSPSGVGETEKRDAGPETSPSDRADKSRSDESRS